MDLHRKFRMKNSLTVFIENDQLHPFLERIKISLTIEQYCKETLARLSYEFVFGYLHNAILLKFLQDMIGEKREISRNNKRSAKTLLSCIPEVFNFGSMNVLFGYKDEVRWKGYYRDGHGVQLKEEVA